MSKETYSYKSNKNPQHLFFQVWWLNLTHGPHFFGCFGEPENLGSLILIKVLKVGHKPNTVLPMQPFFV
jgi:hypothetical protein